ncbi:MAG: hypothetical protein ACYDHG_18280 [Desulfomonilaceae bacterium]
MPQTLDIKNSLNFIQEIQVKIFKQLQDERVAISPEIDFSTSAISSGYLCLLRMEGPDKSCGN